MTTCNLYAQVQGEQELRFVYIAHDESTPTSRLCERLQMVYNDALELPESFAVIFYLANNNNPLIVKVNTPNDNPGDFPMLIDALQNSRFHNSDPAVDVERILEIFSEDNIDIVKPNGEFSYRAVDWSYYVNKTFWSLGLNEAIIANLYWTLEMEKLVSSRYMFITIWHSKGENLGYNRQYPFGKKDICRTMHFQPLQY